MPELVETGDPGAAIVLDAGAAQALQKRMNLLPAGVVEVRGEFEAGEAVAVLSDGDSRIASGVVEYTSDEIREIAGHHSSQIADIIGKYHGAAIIRRWACSLEAEGGA